MEDHVAFGWIIPTVTLANIGPYASYICLLTAVLAGGVLAYFAYVTRCVLFIFIRLLNFSIPNVPQIFQRMKRSNIVTFSE